MSVHKFLDADVERSLSRGFGDLLPLLLRGCIFSGAGDVMTAFQGPRGLAVCLR